jgi:glycerol kinase
MVGDQQGSLIGQGCVRPGLAKITFGTGGMLDVCTGTERADVGAAQCTRNLPDRRVEPRR